MTVNWLKLNAEKTELIWAGSRHSVASLLHGRDPALTLGTDTVSCPDKRFLSRDRCPTFTLSSCARRPLHVGSRT